MDAARLLSDFCHACAAAGFDGLDAGDERLPQRALSDGSEHAREYLSLEVFALANDDDIYVGHSVGLPRQGVGVARGTAKHVGVGGRELDVVGIGPVVMQALPDAARALSDVGLSPALVMHLEVPIGTVREELRAAGSEVGEPGNELLGG